MRSRGPAPPRLCAQGMLKTAIATGVNLGPSTVLPREEPQRWDLLASATGGRGGGCRLEVWQPFAGTWAQLQQLAPVFYVATWRDAAQELQLSSPWAKYTLYSLTAHPSLLNRNYMTLVEGDLLPRYGRCRAARAVCEPPLRIRVRTHRGEWQPSAGGFGEGINDDVSPGKWSSAASSSFNANYLAITGAHPAVGNIEGVVLPDGNSRGHR
jgi:hypothetical protein